MVEHVRLDKWLWAARLFKTRSLATEAVIGGRVHVDGERVKAAKEVRVGDRIDITISALRRRVEVKEISDRRGPASAAAALYEESPESNRRARAAVAGATARAPARSGPRRTTDEAGPSPSRGAPTNTAATALNGTR